LTCLATLRTLPQVDGEPWLQPAAQIQVDFRGTALMLRRLESAPLARMAAGVTEALEASQVRVECSGFLFDFASKHQAVRATAVL
jgi:hypothetical protein